MRPSVLCESVTRRDHDQQKKFACCQITADAVISRGLENAAIVAAARTTPAPLLKAVVFPKLLLAFGLGGLIVRQEGIAQSVRLRQRRLGLGFWVKIRGHGLLKTTSLGDDARNRIATQINLRE